MLRHRKRPTYHAAPAVYSHAHLSRVLPAHVDLMVEAPYPGSPSNPATLHNVRSLPTRRPILHIGANIGQSLHIGVTGRDQLAQLRPSGCVPVLGELLRGQLFREKHRPVHSRPELNCAVAGYQAPVVESVTLHQVVGVDVGGRDVRGISTSACSSSESMDSSSISLACSKGSHGRE